MRLRNTADSWGAGAKLLHWTAAVVILYLLVHGWWMTEFAARSTRLAHYATHASTGYALIALTLARLAWRWLNAVPALPAGTPRSERIAAHAGHWGLYALMLASALTGWALAGTFNPPLDTFFGWFRVPALVSGPDRALHSSLEELHEVLSWSLALLVGVHIAAALYHWRWRRDGVLQRML